LPVIHQPGNSFYLVTGAFAGSHSWNYSSIKGGRGALAGLVFWLPEKICRTPMVYCIGKKNTKNFISPNSVLPRVFLYLVSCPE